MSEPKTRAQAYAAFELARNAFIEKLAAEGEKPEAIAKAISLAPLEVWAIVHNARRAPHLGTLDLTKMCLCGHDIGEHSEDPQQICQHEQCYCVAFKPLGRAPALKSPP